MTLKVIYKNRLYMYLLISKYVINCSICFDHFKGMEILRYVQVYFHRLEGFKKPVKIVKANSETNNLKCNAGLLWFQNTSTTNF